MNFVIQEEREFRSVEVGTYTARLNKIEEKPPTQANPDWGPSLMWEFVVLDDGPHRGDSVAAFTPAVPKTGNGLGKLLRQMMGRNLRPGEQLDGSAFIGKPFTVYVDLNKSGTRTRVISAVPVKTPAAPSSPPAPAPTPIPPAAQKLAAALAGSPPAAPAPAPVPAVKVHVTKREDFQNTSKWAFFSVGEGLSEEAQIQDIRNRITTGQVAAASVMAYVPDSAEWIPFAAVDLPF